jgi:hypothetical protein
MKKFAFAILASLFAVGCIRTDHTTVTTPTGTVEDATTSGPFATHHNRVVQADGRRCLAYKGSIGPTAWDNCADEANGFAQGAGRPQGGQQAVQQPQAPTAVAIGGMPGMPGYGFGAPVAVAIPAGTPAAAAPSGSGASQSEVNKKVRGALNNHEKRIQAIEDRK